MAIAPAYLYLILIVHSGPLVQYDAPLLPMMAPAKSSRELDDTGSWEMKHLSARFVGEKVPERSFAQRVVMLGSSYTIT